MVEILRTRTVAALPHAIWDVLADFGSLSSWVDNVDHSCILNHGRDDDPIGTTRRVQVGRDTLVERIIQFDPPLALVYAIEGLPARLHRVTNRWELRPAGPQSTVVTVTSTVEIGSRTVQKLAERVACRVLARQSDVLLTGLANRLENPRA